MSEVRAQVSCYSWYFFRKQELIKCEIALSCHHWFCFFVRLSQPAVGSSSWNYICALLMR